MIERSMSNMTLENLLNVFWLRPETALWRALDIEAMEGFEFKSPSLDLGCGDGIFSFIRAGGEFKSEFDAFKSVAGLGKFFEGADVFNYCDESFSPAIKRKPNYQIDFGFDQKEALLQKTQGLGLYKETVSGDANSKLPFEDNSIASLFSNIIYWLDDPEKVFNEVSRVLNQGGKACFMLPNETLPTFSFYNSLCRYSGSEEFSFLEKLDRGRLADNIKHAKSGGDWEHLMAKSGLNVVQHKMHLSKTVIQMWDIGLRPLFPVLLKMANEIEEKKLLEIKSEWIEIFEMFLAPIVRLDSKITQGKAPAFHCYIVEKE